jgi:aminoglycoside 6'-N-acetyltransferase I
MRIRPVALADMLEWHRMRCALWPDEDASRFDAEMRDWLARSDVIVLVADRGEDGTLAGFAEVSTRPYADGCDNSPVPYLEGWYVDPDVRRQGIGTALVAAAEQWARERGYTEFASDALLDNVTSQRAHTALGFVEIEKAIHYAKKL